jgi:PhnB protein
MLYLQVEGAAKLIDFVKQAFDARELGRVPAPDGNIMHAEVKIGDSMLEMADAGGKYPLRTAPIHLYVRDVDAVYQRALETGAISISAPQDQFYGDRDSGVRDPFGNHWYIATRLGLK